ncbi:hypothetical protein, partial [Mycolicibacterium sp.]|uniref:hypothetical protein n=1 Tax=Mycolicibacterium sp. TaxID=2320850 RepID=UPI003D0C3D04
LADLPPVLDPDRRVVKIGKLEARIAELVAKSGELVSRHACEPVVARPAPGHHQRRKEAP